LSGWSNYFGGLLGGVDSFKINDDWNAETVVDGSLNITEGD
jgi:hypothetical protein